MNFIFTIFQKIIAPFRGLGLRERVPLFDRAYRGIIKKIMPEFVNIDGIKLFLDAGDAMEFATRAFEPGVTALFKKKIREGGIVIDIGAHIGYYSLLSARLVGPAGKVFAFEPNPSNCALLRRSIAENGFNNIKLVEAAVSDTNGETQLYLSGVSSDSRSYAFGDNREKISVKTIRLDDIFPRRKLPRVDFLKIDVDGFELRAMRGAEELLERTKMIVTEFSRNHLREAGENPEDYFNYLRDLGFKIYLLNEETGDLARVSYRDLAGRGRQGHPQPFNLFCERK